MQQIHNLSRQPLEFVVEIVGEEVDALVGAFDAGADFGEVLRLFVAELVELGAKLAEEFFEFLLERGAALEVVDDFEEDEEDGGQGGGIDQPGGEMLRVRRREFLGEKKVKGKRRKGKRTEHGQVVVGVRVLAVVRRI
jgi:hypothetical protein